MVPFYPVFVRRSDGRISITKSGVREDNAPLPQQLDTQPNNQGVCDYYKECSPGESKELDWRRKLGGMLIRELDSAQFKDKNFILASLPYHYRLYEHVRYKVSESGDPAQKPAKNHAAGSNERQDAYLYGHPQGRKKRYRSPAEFFPHLLWLATDEAGDSNNCSCKFCSPEEIESEAKQAISSKDIKQATSKQDPDVNSPPSLPRLRSQEQKLDAQYNRFLFRSGELIWFQRDRTSWALGAIISRGAHPSNPTLNLYRVQPLSHPISPQPSVNCSQNQLRAWLAWSPPPCLNPDLNPNPANNMIPPTYHTIDWPAYLKSGIGERNAEIDGSILMAKFVETTFTLFDRIESRTSTKESSQTSEIYYNGFFFGSEKIWLGDPLRLRNSTNPNDMMVLRAIIERSTATDPSKSQTVLRGDVYSQSIAKQDPSDAAKQNEQLPLRVQQDLNARNSIAMQAEDPSKRVQTHWKLEAKNVQRALSDIKGRWYESSILMPMLAPAEYEAGRRRGELADATMWMNAQGDCNKPPNAAQGVVKVADTKVKKREDAFGRAVPGTFRISKGLDEPDAANAAGSSMNKSAPVERSAHAPPSTQQRPAQLQPPVQKLESQSPPSTGAIAQPEVKHTPSNQNSNQETLVGQATHQPTSQAQDNAKEWKQEPQEPNSTMDVEANAQFGNIDQYMDFAYSDEHQQQTSAPETSQSERQHQEMYSMNGQDEGAGQFD